MTEMVEKVAKAMFCKEHPGRNWDTDIREDERVDWREWAQTAIDTIDEASKAPQEQAKAKPEYKDPKPPPVPQPVKPPMFGRNKR